MRHMIIQNYAVYSFESLRRAVITDAPQLRCSSSPHPPGHHGGTVQDESLASGPGDTFPHHEPLERPDKLAALRVELFQHLAVPLVLRLAR
jgi:hypothetical protein